MYFIITVLIVVYLIWVWNSTKDFETIVMRLSYLAVGTLFIIVLTLLLFGISSIGVNYPKQEMIGEVRKVILLTFVPLNGIVVLPQLASLFTRVKSGMLSKDELAKKIRILAIIFVILVIIECIYFKNIQGGIIEIINSR